jgi:putative membrane protein
MLLRWIIAALHLVVFGIGFAAIWARARALGGVLDQAGLRRVFSADTLWGVAAVFWAATGLARAFAGLEKGSAYYLASNVFWLKMALFVLVLGLEAWPMVTLIRWRIGLARGAAIDTRHAQRLALISSIQAGLVIAIAVTATALARAMSF